MSREEERKIVNSYLSDLSNEVSDAYNWYKRLDDLTDALCLKYDNDDLTLEQFNCAISWLRHSFKTTEEIMKIIS